MTMLWSDLRYAVRVLLKAPGFAAACLLTLALGIGANSAIFSFVEAVLLRPLPYPQPDRLVQVWQHVPDNPTQGASPANFLDWRSAARSFAGLAAYEVSYRNMLDSGEPLRLSAAVVSPDFFQVFGALALEGRTFSSQVSPRGSREAILSHQLWQERFGSVPSIIGRSIRLDDGTFDVVGVMPAGFGFPERPALWLLANDEVPGLPIAFSGDIRTLRDARYLGVVGRLQPGATLQAAQTEMDAIAKRLAREYPEANTDTGVRLVPLHQQLVGDTAATLILLTGIVAFVLLIASANVANLMLARAALRGREFAIRSSLGAGRAVLLRQLLAESLVLSMVGGALGLFVASWMQPLLATFLSADTLGLEDVGLNGRVLIFTAGVSLTTAMLFGLAPAWQASSQSLVEALKHGAPGSSGPGRDRLRRTLASVEIALALVLVTGAGLMAQTVWRLQQLSPGFRATGVLAAMVSFPAAATTDPIRPRAFYQQIIERLAALPGVGSVGAIHRLPLGGRSMMANIRVDGRSFRPTEAPDVCWRVVSTGYFNTLGIPVLSGRVFASGDDRGAPAVSVVNASLARLLWPSADPIGQQIATGLDGKSWTTVVGVVGDTPQEALGRPALPEMYRPLGQDNRWGFQSMHLVVRTTGDPLALAPAVRSAIWSIDRAAPITDVRTLNDIRLGSIASQRTIGTLLAVFAGLALLLAVVGLYGVMSCLVGERTREFGVRLALGGTRRHIVTLVLERSVWIVGSGLAAGLIVATATTRALASQLYAVGPHDPFTLAAVSVLLSVVGLLASYIPALRATRVDPLVALRTE